MFHKKVAQYALWAWVLAAISAPIAQLAGGASWVWVLLPGTVCSLICWGIQRLADGDPSWGKWFCILQLIWLPVVTGEFARWSASCWPTSQMRPIVPLTLLVLAAVSAWDGAAKASRVGSILAWFLAALYAVLLAAGIKELNIGGMLSRWNTSPTALIAVFLIPATAAFLPREKGNVAATALPIGILFAAAVSLWTAGGLSAPVAGELPQPFYEFVKSLSLFGTAERFEAFLSVALTMGYFALFSLLHGAAAHLAESLKPGWGRPGVVICCAASAAVLMFLPSVPQAWLAVGTLVFWAALPVFAQCTELWKKSKKSEKSA